MPLAATIRLNDEAGSQVDAARAERRTVRERSTLRLEGVAHDVSVDNLSATGCLVRANIPISVGRRLQLGLAGGGQANGTVVRRDARAYGVFFDTPLSPKTLAAAFSGTILLAGPELQGRSSVPSADPDIARWPRPARVAVLLGGAAATWAVVIAVARLLL